jgi:cation diffusion facilitator family transporter
MRLELLDYMSQPVDVLNMADMKPPCVHQHDFHQGSLAAERGTRVVMWLTLVTMLVEIVAGYLSNSMALLADGWHMSSHAVAIGLSMLAYMASRRYARDHRFAFGTWKIEILGGFASALFLVGVAILMVTGSIERLLSPRPIHFAEAIAVAVLGLVVNLVSAYVLHGARDHGHAHHNDHDHAHPEHALDHEPHDLNLRSAYLHVVADAATSVLAIVALLGGMIFGWRWLDPVMGIVGAGVIVVWAAGLLRDTGRILLDAEMDHPVVEEIRDVIRQLDGSGATTLADLHAWRVARGKYVCILSLDTTHRDITPQRVREALAVHEEIVHVTVEINYK